MMTENLNFIDNGSFRQNWNTRGSLNTAKAAGRRSRGAKPFRNNRKVWNPITKLGRLVKLGYVTSLEEIHRNSISITEVEIVDFLLRDSLWEEVLAVLPVVKQSARGPRTRFKAFVAVGDRNGHVGLGIKCYKEIATAIRGAVSNAKLAMVTVRRGLWKPSENQPWQATSPEKVFHTVSGKASGESGNSKVRLMPAPKNTGIVGACSPVQATLLSLAGVQDCYVVCRYSGNNTSYALGNLTKALMNALGDLDRLESNGSNEDPDLWLQNNCSSSAANSSSAAASPDQLLTSIIQH